MILQMRLIRFIMETKIMAEEDEARSEVLYPPVRAYQGCIRDKH